MRLVHPSSGSENQVKELVDYYLDAHPEDRKMK